MCASVPGGIGVQSARNAAVADSGCLKERQPGPVERSLEWIPAIAAG